MSQHSTTATRPTPMVGDTVIDASISDTYGPRYLIGKAGFMNVETGDFVVYDSAFPGPEFFDKPEFVLANPAKQPNMSKDAAEALEEADYRWYLVRTAKTVMEHGEALINLSNAMDSLRTWHPGYVFDDHSGGSLPWEREDEEFNAPDADQG